MATELGITTAVEPQNSLDDLPLFRTRPRRGHAALAGGRGAVPPAGDDVRASWTRFAEAKAAYDDDRFRVGPIKLYIDDVIEPHTAAMLEPYANRPDTSGDTFWPPDVFAELIVELERRGFQTFTHATGDRGDPDGARRGAHARAGERRRAMRVTRSCTSSACIPTTSRASRSSGWWRACSRATARPRSSRLAGERRPGTRAIRLAVPGRCATPGATLAFSSDWNVAEMDPLVWLYTARTRADLDGSRGVDTRGDGRPAERRSAQRPSARAYANFAEDDRGSIEPGKYADLVVLSRDVFADEPASLLETSVDGDDRGRGGGLPAMSGRWVEFERPPSTHRSGW